MAAEMTSTLLFVYNADSGMFNTLSDMAHKVFSPRTYSCNLCALTHSTFSMRDEWKEFIESLGVELEFLHRDEFKKLGNEDGGGGGVERELPAIFLKEDQGLKVLADASSINACNTMDDLKKLIRERLANIPPPSEGGARGRVNPSD